MTDIVHYVDDSDSSNIGIIAGIIGGIIAVIVVIIILIIVFVLVCHKKIAYCIMHNYVRVWLNYISILCYHIAVKCWPRNLIWLFHDKYQNQHY